MENSTNIHNNNPQGPSKLLAFVALILAILLPFFLVKIVHHKPNEPFTQSHNAAKKTTSVSSIPKVDTKPQQAFSENQTVIEPIFKPKAENQQPTKPQNDWQTIKTRNHDSLAAVFSRVGLGSQTLQKILKGNPHAKLLVKLKPNTEIQLKIHNHQLEKMILPLNTIQYFVVTKEGTNSYTTSLNAKKMNSQNHLVAATINGSLYLTAKKNNIPFKLIRQMTDIFSQDINFAKDIKAGDQFSFIYKAFYIEGKLVGVGDILAVSYRNKGKTFQAVQHLARNGQADYYSPQGVSLKKAFDRYPLRFSHISSTFSLARYHPILHYTRAHKGVDLAAPIGTPIRATGSGRIEMIGHNHGYGNMIKIKHDSQFSTIYGHMLKFQKGLSTGSVVHRGDVIGYVGQSGLASGPHCHFEFHVKNQPKNPTTINLPRGLAIASSELGRFKAQSTTFLAQLEHYEKTHLHALASR